MKIKECWRLAKLSLKARKKTTRNTVFGIAFSLIIIIPLLFAIIGLNITVMPQLNENPDLLNCIIPTSLHGVNIPEYQSYGDKYYQDDLSSIGGLNNFYASDHTDFVNSFDNKIQYLIGKYDYSNYELQLNDPVNLKNAIQINEGSFIYRNRTVTSNDYDDRRGVVSILSTLGYVYPNSFNLLKNKLLFLDGKNKSFTGDGTKQILINVRLLNEFNLKPEDVYGKKISYFINSNANGLKVPEDVFTVDHYLLQNYEVVGVYKDYSYQRNDVRNMDMIVSTESYMKNSVPYINYNFKYVTKEHGGQYKCDLDPFSTEVMDKSKDYIYTGGYEFSPFSFFSEKENSNGTMINGEHYYLIQQHNLVFAGEYNKLKKIQKDIKKMYNIDEMTLDEWFSNEFTQYSTFDKYFSLATLVGGVFGGVVLFAALVNMFNTIKHSVDSRKHYLGVMRAIGARKIDIPNLYFAEIFRMLLRAYIAIAIVGSAICVGIKILIDYLASFVTLNITLTISWYLIPIVMAVLALALILIGILYTLICTLNVSRMPITTLLE